MGTNDCKYNKVPCFARKTGNINTSMFAAPKLALVPASGYNCDVTLSYHNAKNVPISLRLKEVQMGTHDFKYNKVPLFARITGNINTSMFAAPKLALVPASRYYCDVT